MPHFDERYREETQLGDGTSVVLRLVRRADGELLRQGFEELSPQTRYLRFFGLKPELSDADVEALTDLDGARRLAICAVEMVDGREHGLAVARFARDTATSEVAEAAITVADRVQNRGLGTLLLQRLAAAASERGVTRFRCELLAENLPVRRMLEQIEGARFELEGNLLRAEVPVPAAGPRDAPATLDRSNATYRILGHSARGAIQVGFQRFLRKGSDDE